MKTLAAAALSAWILTGCVVPVAEPVYSGPGVYGGPVAYGQPSLYGRVDIGNYPPPLIYSQPVIIAPPRYAALPPPIYLQVPPDHHRNWQQYCGQYSACGRPVYFVRDAGTGYPSGSQQNRPVYQPGNQPGYQSNDQRGYQPGYQPGHRSAPSVGSNDGQRWHDRNDRGGRSPPGYRPLVQSDPRVR